MYATIIEWDGGKPPTKWYNRLARFGLNVRGDKGSAPLARRSKDNHDTVIYQEGVIITEALSTAQVLGRLANEMGAVNVSIGQLDLIDNKTAFAVDNEILTRLNGLSRIGRPTGGKAEVKDYAVTCMDEVKTFNVRSDGKAIVCPSCSSFNVEYVEGKRKIYGAYTTTINPDPLKDKKDFYLLWLATRFNEGRFEMPKVYYYLQGYSPAQVENEKRFEIGKLETLSGNSKVEDIEAKYPALAMLRHSVITGLAFDYFQRNNVLLGYNAYEFALRILDYAYVILKDEPKERQRRRIDAVGRLILTGHLTPERVKKINLYFNPLQVDFIDLYAKDATQGIAYLRELNPDMVFTKI